MLRLSVFAVILLLPIVTIALEDVPESTDIEPWPVFDAKDLRTVGFTNQFVPMGRPAKFHCAAVDSLAFSGDNITYVKWVLRYSNETILVNKTVEEGRFAMNGTEEPRSELYAYALQSEHDGIFQCHVQHRNTLENNVTHETVSRIRLYVQDCDEAGESSDYRNLMNPCYHGACQIEATNDTCAPHYLSCDCVEQFTGEYCDVEVEGTLRRELIFWSPVYCYLIAVGIFCLVALSEKRSRRPRISLEGLVPKQPPPVPEHCLFSANPLLDEAKLDALLKALLEEPDEDAPSKPSKPSKKSGPENRN
ncbi:hypothetical protein AAVH_13994 [Aphelenchoides avenae]|nr:hypothetical protein AAVH_13994 [Aphelenchus avenae]